MKIVERGIKSKEFDKNVARRTFTIFHEFFFFLYVLILKLFLLTCLSPILETRPTLSTYNSLVNGFYKARDLIEASKVVKTIWMIIVDPHRIFGLVLVRFDFVLLDFSLKKRLKIGQEYKVEKVESELRGE